MSLKYQDRIIDKNVGKWFPISSWETTVTIINLAKKISLAAIHTNSQLFYRSPGYLTDVFQLINGCKIAAANVTGFHLKCASPNYSLIFSCFHFNMTCRANKGARAAADAHGRILIVRRTYRLLRAPAGKTDRADTDHFFKKPPAGRQKNQ